jgi:predicted nucleic acid-binding protein
VRALGDTSAIFASITTTDQAHALAREFRDDTPLELVIGQPVLEELYTLARRRIGYARAMRLAEEFVAGHAGVVVLQTDDDRAATWAVLREYSGVPLSYADASIVVLARQLRINEVFSFDDDLRQAGLILVP